MGCSKSYFHPVYKKLRLQKPYFYWRLEQRFLGYQDAEVIDYKTRLRLRLGSRILLNHHTFTDKTWYIPFFFERFLNFNGEAIERYAFKNRVVLGIGYNANSKWFYELMHYIQRSRDTVEDDFARTDIIFQLNFKRFFN